MPKKRDIAKALNSQGLKPSNRTVECERGRRMNRVKYACKPDLQELLDVINLIPPDHEMKSSGEIYRRKPLLRQESPEWLAEERKATSAFVNYLEGFPIDIRGIITAAAFDDLKSLLKEIEALPPNSHETEVPDYWRKRIRLINKQIEFYDQLRTMRNNLYRLTEIGKDVESYLGKQLDVVLGVLLIEYAYLDQEGKIRRQPNRFAEIIEDVEVSRIRACLICRKLFWAYRKDKWCCSEEHSRIIRQRQSRSNKKEKGKIYAKFAKRKGHKQRANPLPQQAHSQESKGD